MSQGTRIEREYSIRFYDGHVDTGAYWSQTKDEATRSAQEASDKLGRLGIPAMYHPVVVFRNVTTSYTEWELVTDE